MLVITTSVLVVVFTINHSGADGGGSGIEIGSAIGSAIEVDSG
jgi:hypothetical protein